MRRIVVAVVLALHAPAKKRPYAVIVGEVKQPGHDIVTEKMTIGDLVAAAGGPTDFSVPVVLVGADGRRVEPADLVIAGQMFVASGP